MSAYITPIKVALLVFPFLALAISMIFVINIENTVVLSFLVHWFFIRLSSIYYAPIFSYFAIALD